LSFAHARKRIAAFPEWVSSHLRKKCGISDPQKVFHSFGHTFKDACREAGISQDVHNALTGHTTAGVGEGDGLVLSTGVLDEAVQAIRYGDLNISRGRIQ
jgi:hypothetical protein